MGIPKEIRINIEDQQNENDNAILNALGFSMYADEINSKSWNAFLRGTLIVTIVHISACLLFLYWNQVLGIAGILIGASLSILHAQGIHTRAIKRQAYPVSYLLASVLVFLIAIYVIFTMFMT